MINRSHFPDKVAVNLELTKYHQFKKDARDYKNHFDNVKNDFLVTMKSLVNQLNQFDYDIPEAFGVTPEKQTNSYRVPYRAGIFNFFRVEENSELLENIQQAYWLHLNQEACKQLLEEVATFKYLEQRIPNRALGKIRSSFLSSSKKAVYIESVYNLIEINQKIRDEKLSERINGTPFDVKVDTTSVNHWLENHFDEVQEIYQEILGVTVIAPEKLPNMQSLAKSLDQVVDLNHKLEPISKTYDLLVHDIQRLSSQIMKNDMDNQFNHFSIDDFVLAYPGLPGKVLTANFLNLKELSRYSGRFERIDGIGPKKSQLIQNAYDAFKIKVYENPVFKIDITNLSQDQKKLIQVIHTVTENQTIFNQLFEFKEGMKRIPLRYQNAEKNLELLWCYFESKNSENFSAIQHSIEVMSEKIPVLTDEIRMAKIALGELHDNEIKEWFQSNAASFYALVEKFGGIKKSQVTSDSGIAKEILEKINKQEINYSKLKASLRGWQTFAVKYTLVQKKVLIGDEMGLGKTIESIGVMADLYARGKTHFLVVCPASIIINWEREIEKHSDLPVYRLHGSSRNAETRTWIQNEGVGVTTFETLQRLPIADGFELSGLVVDEAHYVKNPSAKRSIVVHKWADKTPYVMYMTGTAIENNVDEMTALIKTLQPKISEDIQSKDYFVSPGKYREAIAPVYLRRKKEDVLSELPPLTQNEEWETFGPEERIAYEQAVEDGKFMRMRRCAWLGGSPEKSPKLERLIEICEGAKESGEKIIVFSFFRNVISQLSDFLGEQTLLPITGSVSSKQRQEILDDFEKAPAGTVLLSQIVAGGFGLNIQSASIIVFCEPQIKPSLETQAIARAHRMGQTRPVFVYRLLTEKSIDEQMMNMLNTKQNVFDNFAKHSYISDQSVQSVDISDTAMVKNIIQQERERLKLDLSKPIDTKTN